MIMTHDYPVGILKASSSAIKKIKETKLLSLTVLYTNNV